MRLTRANYRASLGMPESINRERLEQVALEDTDFRDTLIGVYLKDAREQLAKLSRAAAESSDETLQRTAHRLKGSSANLGADPLAELCASAERHSQGIDRVEDLACLVSGIEDEFHRVEITLEAIVEEGSP